MSTTPLLGIQQVAATQNQKEVTINDAVLALESAGNAFTAISMSAGSVTLTPTQYASGVCFECSGASSAVTLTVPLTQRLFCVNNLNSSGGTITVGGATGANVSVAVGTMALVYCDGTNCYTITVSATATTATTQALSDASNLIATDQFVWGLVGGLTSVSVAGGSTVALTAVQAANAIIVLTGALTANISVTVPTTTKTWVVVNNTTGAYTVTFKTTSGTGVSIPQSSTMGVYCDGTNVRQTNPMATATTQALNDSSAAVATDNFVQGLTGGYLSVSVAGGSSVTLTAVQAARPIINLTGAITANISVFVPATSKKWTVANNTTGAFTVTFGTASGTGVAIPQGEAMEVYCDGTNVLSGAKPRNMGVLLAQFVFGTIVQNGTFWFAYRAPYAGTIESIDALTGTGSFTVDVEINGTGVTGISAVAVTSTPTNMAATGANTFNAGDTIVGVISSASGSPTGAVLSLNTTWS
jgi:hypothetical protein